jgi:hypothetical protein
VWEYEGVAVFAGCLQRKSDLRRRVDNAPGLDNAPEVGPRRRFDY